jgi:hypothetical protein
VRIFEWGIFEKMLFHGKVHIWVGAVTDEDGCRIGFLCLRLVMRQPMQRKKWTAPSVPTEAKHRRRFCAMWAHSASFFSGSSYAGQRAT